VFSIALLKMHNKSFEINTKISSRINTDCSAVVRLWGNDKQAGAQDLKIK
jgi:hypothetical protein